MSSVSPLYTKVDTEQTNGQASTSSESDAMIMNFFGKSRVWPLLSMAGGLVLCALACTEWATDWILEWILDERIHAVVQRFDKSIPRQFFAGLGVACIISAAAMSYIPVVIDSESFRDMIDTVSRNQQLRSRLIEEFQTVRRNAYKRFVGTLIIIVIVILTVLRAPYCYAAIAFSGSFLILAIYPLYTVTETFLHNLNKVCSAGIDVVISMMGITGQRNKPSLNEFAESGNIVDWHAVANAYRKLDIRMEQLWSLNHASAILVPLLMIRLLSAFYLVVIALATLDIQIQILLIFGAFALLGNATVMLWPVACVTDKCINGTSKAGLANEAIPAVATRFVGDRSLSPEQRIDHFRFLQFIQTTTVGVEICGILITKAFVLNVARQLVTSFPLIMTVLSNLVKNPRSPPPSDVVQ